MKLRDKEKTKLQFITLRFWVILVLPITISKFTSVPLILCITYHLKKKKKFFRKFSFELNHINIFLIIHTIFFFYYPHLFLFSFHVLLSFTLSKCSTSLHHYRSVSHRYHHCTCELWLRLPVGSSILLVTAIITSNFNTK